MKTKILATFIIFSISLNGMAQSSDYKTVIRKDHKGIVQSMVTTILEAEYFHDGFICW